MELLRFGRVNLDLQYNQGEGAKKYMCKYITKQAGPKQATYSFISPHHHFASITVVTQQVDKKSPRQEAQPAAIKQEKDEQFNRPA